jgi:hypothetical protein
MQLEALLSFLISLTCQLMDGILPSSHQRQTNQQARALNWTENDPETVVDALLALQTGVELKYVLKISSCTVNDIATALLRAVQCPKWIWMQQGFTRTGERH